MTDTAADDIETIENQFAENPDDAELRRALHAARVKSGWREFMIDAVSGVNPISVIPWVSISTVVTTEEWGDTGAPSKDWLLPVDRLEDGLRKTITNHRICDDNRWRRDVHQEFYVVAIEDLEHLCSVVDRMEDLILFKTDESAGLQKLTIFDRSGE